MKKTAWLVVCAVAACALGLAGCGSGKGVVEPPGEPEMFVTASACAACHNDVKAADGTDLSFAALWAPSMHANAARDPYFLATVRAEVDHHPDLRAGTEETCGTCHLGMAVTTARADETSTLMLDAGFLDPAHALHDIGVDGVSCTLCHQIQGDGMGEPEHFSGGYVIDLVTDKPERPLYGPFEPQEAVVELKQSSPGFLLTQGMQVRSPEYCASCHTLYTQPVDAQGQALERSFPEQMPYLEWENSAFQGQQTCQDCHMPAVEGPVMLAIAGGGEPRGPVGQHTFVGANGYMMTLLAANADSLGVTATEASLQDGAQRSQDFLQQQTADLAVDVAQEGEALRVTVAVTNRAGHKFPTGYPSRRAWLHVSVADASGKVVFESGGVDASGRIAGNDNDQDAGKFEPHYERITEADQVQIYEAMIGNSDGEVTTELIRAASYLKDNRLLPDGFDKAGAAADIRVLGEAAEDEDFTSGGDRLIYEIALGGAKGPFQVTVQLLYQPIAYRWAENHRIEDSAEAEAFMEYIADTPLAPVVVAEVTR